MIMSSSEIKITKCSPGYAWGYTPTGSTEVVDNIAKDFTPSLNAKRINREARQTGTMK